MYAAYKEKRESCQSRMIIVYEDDSEKHTGIMRNVKLTVC